MYEYISGRMASLTPTTAVIDCGGVGYLMEITLSTYQEIQKLTNEVRLWVHEVIREDAHLLYGFYSTAEREMFRLLIGVNGVGSATARMILSTLSVDELQRALATKDAKIVQRAKGVGAKTAQRIIMELQDHALPADTLPGMVATASQSKEEALSALVMLGFPKAAADKVLQPLDGTLPVEELIKEALKRL